MFAKRHGGVTLAALTCVAACSNLPPSPRDLLDEHTGVTVTTVGAPLDFARVSYEAANSTTHDYLTLVALRIDNAGKYTELFLLYRWSAAFSGMPAPPDGSTGKLIIDIDEHVIELQPLERLPAGLPRTKELFAPETADVVTRAYVTDLETMGLIASSRKLTARLPQESLNASFSLWRDGRPALARFVKQLSEP